MRLMTGSSSVAQGDCTRYIKMDLEMLSKEKIGNIILSPARDGPGPDLCLSRKETDLLTKAKVNFSYPFCHQRGGEQG